MSHRPWTRGPGLFLFVLLALVSMAATNSAVDTEVYTLAGKVTDASGTPIGGATVSAFTDGGAHNVTVYSQPDGTFEIGGLPGESYEVRARLIGYSDALTDAGQVSADNSGLALTLKKASAAELQLQRPGNNLLDMLTWSDEKDALNFKMMCTYCHQVGTLGFRSPEEPVDWEVMLTRMDGFQGLYQHTQDALVDKIVSVYGREAEAEWPDFEPPAPPTGAATEGKVWEWTMGVENGSMIHDLELGADGKVYTVDMVQDAIVTLDPMTGERTTHPIPGGKEYGSDEPPIKGPHSLEMDTEGHMWVTLALSGEMGFFDTNKNEWRVVSGHMAPRPRSGYPHTLRIDEKGWVWWTDAALGVFSLDPKTYDAENNRYDVKYYKLPSKDQVQGGGARGESRGITPYGIDIAPNGHIWYGKLNGQRIGRIIPELADDDPKKIMEWKPPVHGPRRMHVAPNGLVWVPGWASGDIASFDPVTEEWAVYQLPKGPNSLPYALNIEPETGHVWVCGTGTDSLLRFDPENKTFTEYNLPTRVTYTRELEFDDEGHVWTVNSNWPTRHIENGMGSVIRLSPKHTELTPPTPVSEIVAGGGR
ncbi:MAG: carboxypeptidase regulatory-like domain-containing protein [Acidobacteriota bacterium]